MSEGCHHSLLNSYAVAGQANNILVENKGKQSTHFIHYLSFKISKQLTIFDMKKLPLKLA